MIFTPPWWLRKFMIHYANVFFYQVSLPNPKQQRQQQKWVRSSKRLSKWMLKSFSSIFSFIFFCNFLFTHLRFWYHVLTWQSLRSNLWANSCLSWTLRYFCRSKDFSSVCSWWSVKAVRALRCFLLNPLISLVEPLLMLLPSSSLPPKKQKKKKKKNATKRAEIFSLTTNSMQKITKIKTHTQAS